MDSNRADTLLSRIEVAVGQIDDRGGRNSALIAEIDLTGVPAILLEPLLSKSCDALRWVTSWTLESIDFLAQADVASQALEIGCASESNP